MEISNKHLVSRYTIKINGRFENLTILFDTGVIGEIFMDESYAQQHNILFISLIKLFLYKILMKTLPNQNL